FLDGGEGILFALEDARRADVAFLRLAGELDHASFRGEVAAQDRDAARLLERILARADDRLAARLLRLLRLLADRLAGDGDRVLVEKTELHELARDHGHTAGVVHLGSRVGSPGLEVGEDGSLPGDAIEVADLELDARLARDREEMEHGVRRPSRRHDARDRVLERLARDDLARPDALLE